MAKIADLEINFKKLIKSGNLAQGYILFGHESQSERKNFTGELASYFETKKWEIGPRALSDVMFIDARQGGGIDLIREASHFLWQRPAVSRRRMLVIDRADELTLQAQNAILKIAEEPPSHALIILLVKNYEILLPAVRSRFQKIYVHKNSKSEISNSKFKIPNKEALKEITEDDQKLEEFIANLIMELRRDTIKNHRVLKELLHRWSMIKQFNVNKRLQLEAVWTKLLV